MLCHFPSGSPTSCWMITQTGHLSISKEWSSCLTAHNNTGRRITCGHAWRSAEPECTESIRQRQIWQPQSDWSSKSNVVDLEAHCRHITVADDVRSNVTHAPRFTAALSEHTIFKHELNTRKCTGKVIS